MKKRFMSLDFLRIVAMLMVVILHLLSKGCALDSLSYSIRTVSWFLEAFCIGAVNIYVLISGYFLYESEFK